MNVQRDRRGDDRFAAGQAAQADQRALAGRDRAGGAESKSVNPSRRRGSASASVSSSAPATSNSGVKPLRLSGGVEIKGASARSTGRPLPVADRSTPARWPTVVYRSMNPG